MIRCAAVVCIAAGLAAAQTRDWNKPFPAHKVIGNVYFVGTAELGSFLITTPQGHILVNSDFETTVPIIRESVEKLGFKFSDIKILLGSHAHADHMQGDAMVKELTGAKVMAMDLDVPALRLMKPGGKDHPIDRILKDHDEVKLGNVTMTAILTPGHTKGCTSWYFKTTEGGKTYDVLILGSIGVNPGYILVNNKDYPEIADDYVRSFKTLRAMHVDVFLASHGSFYGLDEKYPRMAKYAMNPFIDPAGFEAHVDRKEKEFLTELEKQKSAAR